MSPGLPILYLCSLAGFAIIIGSIWLLWKRRIFLDRETKQVSEIELPIGIKVKTQLPVILLIAIGAMLLAYSASEVGEFGEEVTAEGELTGATSGIQLYASIDSAALPGIGPFSVQLPVTHPARKYTLLYMVNGVVLNFQQFDPRDRAGKPLPKLAITLPKEPRLVGEIDPVPPGY